MGTDDDARERLAAVLASDVPVLVDADGLTLLAADRGLLDRAAPTLLTPHAGELGRLLGVDPADIEARRLEHARRAAAETGRHRAAQGLHHGDRGARTGGHRCGPTSPARSWLATAGTGDVLSGLAGSLLAQGLEVGEAAAAAAYLHGLAARLAARPGPGRGPGWPGRAGPARRRLGLSDPERPRAGYAEAPIAAADVVGALPDAIRSVRRRADSRRQACRRPSYRAGRRTGGALPPAPASTGGRLANWDVMDGHAEAVIDLAAIAAQRRGAAQHGSAGRS